MLEPENPYYGSGMGFNSGNISKRIFHHQIFCDKPTIKKDHNDRYDHNGSASVPSYPPPPFPPSQPETKRGSDATFRDVKASDVTSETMSSGPRKIYVPSPGFPDLDTTLRRLGVKNQPNGYRLILKWGTHQLNNSYNSDLSFLRIEGADWTPSMVMGYVHGGGRHRQFQAGQ